VDENQLTGLLIELSETVRQNAVYKSFVSPSASLVDREQTAQVESLIIHQDLPDRLVELVRPTKTVLVLGGPGSGKTTLSMMLTEAATRLSPALLPIPIDVQTLMQAETREQVIRESVPGVSEEVIQQLDTGQRLLLLIDGLNEIEHSRTVGERARNVALSMVTGRERNAVLATSRVPVPSLFKGRGIFGARDTVEVALLPFDDDQIRALIARYPQIDVGEFDEYLDTGQLRSLASNPQLLSMLITIFLGKRETAVGPGEVPAPHSVSELFDLFFDTKWSEKAPLVSQPDVGRLTFQRALSSLAWHARLHGLPAVPKEQWADLLSPFDHLIGRDGLSRQTIIDRASALYLMELRARGLSFIHERFLDYFAARFLHELGWIPESFWNLREWEQTLSFLAGMKDADGFLFLLDQSIRRNRTSLACQMAAANFGRLRTENLHDVFQLVATSLYGPRPRRDDAVQGLREFPISDAIDSLRQTLPDIPVTDRQSINRAIELMRLSRLTPESFQNARRRAERRLRDATPQRGRARTLPRYGATSHNEWTTLGQDIVTLADIDAPPHKRGAAAKRLGTRGLPEALNPLINALKDEAPGVRGSAATALAALGDRRAVEPLIAALKDEADKVRGSAATALAALGDRGAVGPLVLLLKDVDTKVRGSAATALAALGDRRAVEPLINALKDEDSMNRGSAATALAALGDHRAVEPLINALKDEAPDVRGSAATALGFLGDQRAIEPILALIYDAEAWPRSAAANALARLGGGEALVSLIRLCNDSDARVRGTALRACLSVLNTQMSAQFMKTLRDDPDGINRTIAIEGLGLLGNPEAVAPVMECLWDSDAGARGEAARALVRLLPHVGEEKRKEIVSRLVGFWLHSHNNDAANAVYYAIRDMPLELAEAAHDAYDAEAHHNLLPRKLLRWNEMRREISLRAYSRREMGQLRDREREYHGHAWGIAPMPGGEGLTLMKTVLEIDLVGYSSLAAVLDETLGPESVANLNQRIQHVIGDGLAAVGLARESTVMATTGDGAILVFEKAEDAHRFAEHMHRMTREYNSTKTEASARLYFRIGAATGNITMQPRQGGGYDIAGITIARAVRLEAAARPGELLVDTLTYEALPPVLHPAYEEEESVRGKRDESFAARRSVMNRDVPQHLLTKPAPPLGDASGDRHAILNLFEQLIPKDQLDLLVFLLDVPITHHPSKMLSLFDRQTHLLNYMTTVPDGLQKLESELQYLINKQRHS